MTSLSRTGTIVRLCVALCFATLSGTHNASASETDTRWNTEDLTFKAADGVMLAGSLIAPRDAAPKAAAVLVHGSGPTQRYAALGALMALRGIAVLTYDKRGVGQSAGHYEDADNVSSANLQLLASDASAAMSRLASDPRWQTIPRGFVGISQGGWVIPLALAYTQKLDFVGFWSGPSCTTSEQLQFQRFSDVRGYDPSRYSADEVAEVMKQVKYRPDDVDPLKALTNKTLPMMWLFGSDDPYVPVALSTRRLQERIDRGQSNFSYRVFPHEGHNLADSSQQESFLAMIEWIKRIAAGRVGNQAVKP